MSMVAPCEGMETVPSVVELRPLGGDNVPSGGSKFALGGGHFAGGRLFFRDHGSLERLFEKGFGRGEI